MRLIVLSRGFQTQVDEADYEFLSQWLWFASDSGNGCFYAARNKEERGGLVYLHKVVGLKMGLSGRIDHKDQDKLNNQRYNLRASTQEQNNANRPIQWNNLSGFKGVSWNAKRQAWYAFISYKNRTIALGSYSDPIQAAKAYNRAAKRLYGEFASLNTVEE